MLSPLSVSSSSWHGYLVSRFTNCPRYTDTCQYVRSVAKALVLLSLAILGAGLVLYVTGDTLGYLAACLVYWSIMDANIGAFFGCMILSIILFFLVVCTLGAAIESIRYSRQNPIRQTVQKLGDHVTNSDWYNSIKNKYCKPIIIEK